MVEFPVIQLKTLQKGYKPFPIAKFDHEAFNMFSNGFKPSRSAVDGAHLKFSTKKTEVQSPARSPMLPCKELDSFCVTLYNSSVIYMGRFKSMLTCLLFLEKMCFEIECMPRKSKPTKPCPLAVGNPSHGSS